MFRLYDGRAQALAEVRPGRGRDLRLRVDGSPADQDAGLADLRLWLLADLVRRTAQLHRLTVSLDGSDAPGPGSSPPAATLTSARAVLNIHRPEDAVPGARGVDLTLLAAGLSQGAQVAQDAQQAKASAPWVAPGSTTATPDLSDPLAALAAQGQDPLALRLVFLEHHYRQPIELTWPALTQADATLREWRRQVAVWATSPSKPMCAEYVSELTGAFDDDLDTPAALRALRALAVDAEIPPGSKFETAAHIDQLLGLDLVSEVGRAG